MQVSTDVAIVTGAGSGIGRATAQQLAAQGTKVILADVDLKLARQAAHDLPNTSPIYVDVSNTDSVQAMVNEVVKRFGQIDILINNAGYDEICPFVQSSEDLWDRLLAVNLKGQIACAHAVLPTMIKQKSGRIICIASDAGRVGSSGEAVYSAAKGGVIAFVKALAREVARYDIKVNAIAPGPTDTPLLKQLTSTGSDRLIAAIVKATPLRRIAQPEDIASTIAFFASDASGYVTGQTLSVNGGLTMI